MHLWMPVTTNLRHLVQLSPNCLNITFYSEFQHLLRPRQPVWLYDATYGFGVCVIYTQPDSIMLCKQRQPRVFSVFESEPASEVEHLPSAPSP